MAGNRVADLLIKIGADSYEFQQKMQQTEKGLGSLVKRLDKVGKEMSLKLTAPLAALGAVSLNLADIQVRSEIKVQQAIKSTSGAAKLSFDQLKQFASELQGKTIFGDEKILNDSTAQLLTFTNLAGQNFKRAQAAAMDLSTVLDGDLKSASLQLGKALNDPVKSLSALARSGIQFSKEQTNVIKNLAETNRLAEAQSLILDELERQYGGQAEAAASVGLGALKQLKNSWGDFLEQIGAILMPVVNQIAGVLSKVVLALQNMDPVWKKFAVTIGVCVAAVGPLALTLGSVLKLLPILKSGFATLIVPIAAVKTGMIGLNTVMSTNAIALLLTLITTGVGLYFAFGRSVDSAAEANGKLTNKLIDESKQVNVLIGKLSSSTTSEKERKAALEELKAIQPDIVSGLKDESLELETLKKHASEYNQQLVLRIALARKQDQVSAAVERQMEAGIKLADKEADLYQKLAEVGANLSSGKFTYNSHRPTSEQQLNLVEQFNEIIASGDRLDQKAKKVWSLFKPQKGGKINMSVKPREIMNLLEDLRELKVSVNDAGALAQQAEVDVKGFAKAFSLSLTPAVETTTDKTEELGNNLGGPINQVTGKIALLNEELKRLEDKKSTAFDDKEIAGFNKQIEDVKKQIASLNSLMPEDLEPIVKLEPLLGDLDVKELIVPIKIKPEFVNLASVASDATKQLAEVRRAVTEGIYGWADTTNATLRSTIQDTVGVVSKHTNALMANGWKFEEALSDVVAGVKKVEEEIEVAFRQMISGGISSVSEVIGGVIAGDLGLDNILAAIVQSVAGFLKQVGTLLIEFAVLSIQFKTALSKLLSNPWVALGVGAAMIAAAGVMTSLIQKKAQSSIPKLAKGGLAYGPTYAMVGDNPNAQVDPEVIAPLSKLQGMMTRGATSNISLALSGQLIAKGRDLVYVLGKENFKLNLIG